MSRTCGYWRFGVGRVTTSPNKERAHPLLSQSGLARGLTLAIVGSLAFAGSSCQRSGSSVDDGKSALRWGADEEGGAPYISRGKDGNYVGFEVDLAEALAKEIGRPIEYTPKSFKSLVDDLERGDIDLAMNGLEVTPDRQKIVRLSRPYYVYRLQLVTRKDDDRFAALADLEGKKDVLVATLENTAASRLLKKLGIPAKTYDDQVNPYNELADKVVDAVLLDLPIAIYVVQKNPVLNTKLKFVGPPIEKGHYAIAFRKDNEALARQFDEALGRLVKNGELQRILEKWELWNDDQKELTDAAPPATPSPKK
jgi:polar amino acid transport system substrate-binding protein